MKVIDEITSKLGYLVDYLTPRILVISKDVEREMFLDESFEKGLNILNKINVEGIELEVIVVDSITRRLDIYGDYYGI